MKHIVKHGKTQPSVKDLDEFQLGWCTSTKKLYINDEGKIRIISSTVVLSDDVCISNTGKSIPNSDTYSVSAKTEDNLNITISLNLETNIINLRINSLDDKNIPLQNAITHKEYFTESGFTSSNSFVTITLDSFDIDIINFPDAINKNFYAELFFTIRGYDYKIELRSTEDSSTSTTVLVFMSRTISQ